MDDWRLKPDKVGVLLVDLQERLLPAIDNHEGILKKVRDLVAVAKILGMPVYISEHMPEKLGPTHPAVRELVPDVEPVRKVEFSAAGAILGGGGLSSDGLGFGAGSGGGRPAVPKNLLVCGVEAHVCVRQTVYDLRARDRVPHVVADGVGSRRGADCKAGLADMRQSRVLVTTVEMAAFEMLGGADGDSFKAVLAILK